MSFAQYSLVPLTLLPLMLSVSSLLSKMPESLLSLADFSSQLLQQQGLLDVSYEQLAPA
jgi:hypothetical protein